MPKQQTINMCRVSSYEILGDGGETYLLQSWSLFKSHFQRKCCLTIRNIKKSMFTKAKLQKTLDNPETFSYIFMYFRLQVNSMKKFCCVCFIVPDIKSTPVRVHFNIQIVYYLGPVYALSLVNELLTMKAEVRMFHQCCKKKNREPLNFAWL